MPENNVDALLSRAYWSSNVIGYFFADSLGDYRYRYPLFVYGFQPVGGSHQNAVRNILEGTYRPTSAFESYMTLSSVEAVANITLYSTGTSPSEIAIGRTTLLDRSLAYYPDPTWSDTRAGDVWLASNITNAPFGSFQYYTIMHELGHALGLKHGHEPAANNPAVLTPDRDSIEFSVMTYRTYVGDPHEHFGDATSPQTLMMYDIAALQHIYGANFTTNNTDSYYIWDPSSGGAYVNGVEVGRGSSVFMTVWDGGGIDTYDFSFYGQEMVVDLTPGGWSRFSDAQLAYLGDSQFARGNVFNALQYQGDPRSLIENAVGGNYSDSITGNSADNRLFGGLGNDTLAGGAGYDTLEGGGGDDWMDGGPNGDVFLGGDGWDTVSYLSAAEGAVTVDLTTGQNWGDAYGDVLIDIESVRGSNFGDFLISRPQGAHLYGERGDDYLFGKGGSDGLFGGEGNDTLDGGGGADWLIGNAGRDTFLIRAGTSGALIADFAPDETIVLSQTSIASFSALVNAASQVGADIVVAATGIQFRIANYMLANLAADDFQFA